MQKKETKKILQKIVTISLLNLHSGKSIKSFSKQIQLYNGKNSLKQSCFGQVLVFRNEGIICFWNIQTTKQIRAHRSLKYLKLSPNCQNIVQISSVIGKLNLWRLYDTNQNLQIECESEKKNTIFNNSRIKFTKDSKTLILLEKNNACLWKISESQQIYKKISVLDARFEKLKFSPNGELLAAQDQHKFTLCNIEQGKTFHNNFQDYISDFKFSPDGKIFIFLTFYQLCYMKIKDQLLQYHLNYLHDSNDQNIRKIKFFDNKTLIFSFQNKIIFCKLGRKIKFQSLQIHPEKQINFNISSDKSRLILSSFYNGLTYLYNLKNFQRYSDSNAIWKTPSFLSLSPKSENVCLIYDCQAIQIRSLNDLRVVEEFYFDHQKPESLIISPDFKKLAFSNKDQIIVQRIDNRGVIQDQKLEEKVQLMQFSPNGEYLAGYSNRYEGKSHFRIKTICLIVWNIQNWEKIYFCLCKFEEIFSLEFSKDSSQIAVGLKDHIQITNLNNAESKKLIDKLFQKQEIVDLGDGQSYTHDSNKALSFSPNGKLLASANKIEKNVFEVDNMIPEIRVWRIKDEQIIQRLRGHEKQISKIIFLVDEMIIVSASEDCSIRLWNIQIGEQIQILNFHKSKIIHLSISLEGTTMITGDNYGLIYLWSKKDNLKYQKILRQKGEVVSDCQQQLDNFKASENSYSFVLLKSIGNQNFSADNCSTDGSKFISSEGFNIQSVFIKKLNAISEEQLE